jgi:metallo-beta-lactamase class B
MDTSIQNKLVILLLALPFSICGQSVKEPKAHNENWSKPYPAFRIAGNLYYVGTHDLACYLITTPQGHILINTGLVASAGLIEDNVKALGFRFQDIKILLTTQAHYDHLGAMAAIKKKTGAQLMVDEKDALIIADGGRSDYAFGREVSSFEPVNADRLLKDNDIIQIGKMQLTMLHHPGHTKGSCSFLFTVKDDKRSYKVLIANLPTIVVEKKLNDVAAYPDISEDYAFTLKAMKNISFDLWFASHASQFNLHAKHKPGDAYNPATFIDRQGYKNSLDELQREYDLKK